MATDILEQLADWEARVADAIDALEAVLLDPQLGNYQPQREALLSALGWLEVEITCGDCVGGRCHWGRRAVTAVDRSGAGRRGVRGPRQRPVRVRPP